MQDRTRKRAKKDAGAVVSTTIESNAASGTPSAVPTTTWLRHVAPPPVSITTLLEMDTNTESHEESSTAWASSMKAYVDKTLLEFLMKHQAKVAVPVPQSVLLIPPLEITSAASGAQLQLFVRWCIG